MPGLVVGRCGLPGSVDGNALQPCSLDQRCTAPRCSTQARLRGDGHVQALQPRVQAAQQEGKRGCDGGGGGGAVGRRQAWAELSARCWTCGASALLRSADAGPMPWLPALLARPPLTPRLPALPNPRPCPPWPARPHPCPAWQSRPRGCGTARPAAQSRPWPPCCGAGRGRAVEGRAGGPEAGVRRRRPACWPCSHLGRTRYRHRLSKTRQAAGSTARPGAERGGTVPPVRALTGTPGCLPAGWTAPS